MFAVDISTEVGIGRPWSKTRLYDLEIRDFCFIYKHGVCVCVFVCVAARARVCKQSEIYMIFSSQIYI